MHPLVPQAKIDKPVQFLNDYQSKDVLFGRIPI